NNVYSVLNQHYNFGTRPYNTSLQTAALLVNNQFNNFDDVHSLLPDLSYLSPINRTLNYARQATISISNLSSPWNIDKMGNKWIEPGYGNSIIYTPVNSSLDLYSIRPQTEFYNTHVNNNWLAINRDSSITRPWLVENIENTHFKIPSKSSILNTFENQELGHLSKNSFTSVYDVNSNNIWPKLSLHSEIIKATSFSLFAEKSFSLVNSDNIASRLYLSNNDSIISSLNTRVTELSYSYSNLNKFFEVNPSAYSILTNSVGRIAPSEYFLNANLIEAISIEEDITIEEELIKGELYYENEITLNEFLPKISIHLLNMWKGAIESITSNNPDRVRQSTSSLRELFTHLMKALAPDKEIRIWTQDAGYYHNNNPTRRARLHFIFKNINLAPLNDFVEKEVEAMLAFIDVFQKTVHSLESKINETQLLSLKSKAESTIKYLLQVHFAKK
ncbi:MAG: hypothetical protein WAR99_15500, partial [Saprospiraceae bacterium]